MTITTAACGGTVRSTGHGALAFLPLAEPSSGASAEPAAQVDEPLVPPGATGAEPTEASSAATGSKKLFSKSASSASASAGSRASVGCKHTLVASPISCCVKQLLHETAVLKIQQMRFTGSTSL